ncbi:MAG: hypothetical protein ACRDIE_20210 [Chloroflexota bacterium]
MTLRRKILLVAIGLVVVVGVACVAVWRRAATSSSSVSVSTAVNQFRQAAGGSVTGPPLPGVYTYSLHGNECAGVAGVHLCRSFPSRARMILTRKPGTVTIELDLSQDHIETSRYVVHPDGRYLASQRTKIVFGIAQDDNASTKPATLALPAALRVGLHWTQRFSAGGLPVTTTNRVVRQTTMAIGGAKVMVYEIDADSKTGGAHPGTENDVTWHSPSSGLDVRLTIHRRIGGIFPYTMDLDATLQSLKPLR